jgi:hypothetical protein
MPGLPEQWPPNPYEAPTCQEAHDSCAQHLGCVFALGAARLRSCVLSCFPRAGADDRCLHHTHMAALSSSRRRRQRNRGAGSAAEQRVGALVPSSAMGRRHGHRAPVRARCGSGAAHVRWGAHRRRHRRWRRRPRNRPGSGRRADALRCVPRRRLWPIPARHAQADPRGVP